MKFELKYKHFTIENTSFFKGIGILLIAFHNFYHWVAPNTGENEFDFSADRIHNLWEGLHYPAESINLLFSYFGHYGVQLFILFSGYGLMRGYMNRKISWTQFMLKRINKLYPAFIIAALVLIGFNFYKYNVLPGYGNYRDFFVKFSFLSNLIPGKALTINGPWWFYSMIVQLYAVFPLIVLLYKKFKEISIFILVAISYVVLILFNDYFISIDATLYYQFVGHLPEFLLGVFFATRKEIKLNIFVVIGFVILFILGNFYKYPWYFSHLSITIILFVAVNYLIKILNKNNLIYKTILFYGEISMYLFAVHGFIRSPFVSIANERHSAYYSILIAISFIAISTLVALGVRYIEKNYLQIRKQILEYFNDLESHKKIVSKIFDFFRLYYKYIFVLIIVMLLIKIVELFMLNDTNPLLQIDSAAYYIGIYNDFFNILGQSIIFIIPFLILFFISKKLTKVLLATTIFIIILLNIILIKYFITGLVPLDHVIFVYTFDGLLKIVSSSVDINFYTFLPFIAILLIYILIIRIFKVLKLSSLFILFLLSLSFIYAKNHNYYVLENNHFENDTQYFYANNKLTYFTTDIYKFLKEKKNKPTTTEELNKSIEFYHNSNKDYISNEYPLLYNENYDINTLGNYFKADKSKKPNIVFIIVESLCDQISGKYASLGSYTPFIDSLTQHSLYWRNNLSTSERTFGILPAILGSLPPAKTGFMETDKSMPLHFSLISLLSKQDYESNFYYGGWMDFDNMKNFLLKNQITNLVSDYDSTYSLDTASYDSWGYPDQILLKKGGEDFTQKQQPFIDIFLTLSTHSPFLIRNQEVYEEKVRQIIIDKKYNAEFLNSEKSIKMLSTISYLDDALKLYFNKIKSSDNFNNTIFIITGDHKMGPIPTKNSIEKYHVPLIIYSPMLTKPKEFGGLVSHYDIAPSLASLLQNNYNIELPSQVHYIGTNLDTSEDFNTNNLIPFMRINRDIIDVCYKNKYISNGNVYTIEDNMKTKKSEYDSNIAEYLKSFKDINNYVCNNNKLIPANLFRTLDIASYIHLTNTNFDKYIPELYKGYISQDTSYSGNNSILLKPEHEFLEIIPKYEINNTYDRLYFNISFNILCKDTSQGVPIIVCNVYDKDGNTIFWNKIDFFHTSKIENNKWININENMQVTIDNPQVGYKFKSYIWNYKSTFYIDDLDISVNGKPIR